MAIKSFSPTTLVVFEEVLKRVSSAPHYFYPRDIIDELGVSRQHVNNLLTRLVGNGLLERDRAKYTCPPGQLPALIEYIVGASDRTDNPNVRIFAVEGVIRNDDAIAIRTMTNVVLKAQGLQHPGYSELKQAWIDRMEQAQAALKKELKFLRSHSSTTAKIDDETYEECLNFLEKNK